VNLNSQVLVSAASLAEPGWQQGENVLAYGVGSIACRTEALRCESHVNVALTQKAAPFS